MTEFCIVTVCNEDEVVSVEILEGDMTHTVENFYAALGYSVHIGMPEFDDEPDALPSFT